MEAEFKVRNPTPTAPYAPKVIAALRQTRKEHPLADAVAGTVPLVGGIQAGMDATDPDVSDAGHLLALASILPGAKLMRMIAGKLRSPAAKAVEHTVEEFHPEDIFQKPNVGVTTTPETVKAANDAYTKQLLQEEATHNVVPIGKQKLTAQQIRKNQQKAQDMLDNVDNIDTSGPQRKLPAESFFKNAEDEGNYLMGADRWERTHMKWDDQGRLLHPKDGWIGPDHPDYLEPLDDYAAKVKAWRDSK